MPTITWDINATTVFVFVSGLIAFYLGVMRQRDTVRQNTNRIDGHSKDIDGIRLQIASGDAALKMAFENRDKEFADYRERIAREYCTQHIIAEVETRIVNDGRDREQRLSRLIEALSARLDKVAT